MEREQGVPKHSLEALFATPLGGQPDYRPFPGNINIESPNWPHRAGAFLQRLRAAVFGNNRFVSAFLDIDASAAEQFEAKYVQAEELLCCPCTLVAAAPRLHQGWELDEWMWLVDAGGRIAALTTDHGRMRLADEADIHDDIARYAAATKSAQVLITRLG